MNRCEDIQRFVASRGRLDGAGILHPSWLEKAPTTEVVAGLAALGFRPEYPDRRRSPTPFRRYFDRRQKQTLLIESWSYECLGRYPELASTKAKRLVQYQQELQRRLEGDVPRPLDAAIRPGVAADVVCTSWWAKGPKVRVRTWGAQEYGPWSWEATSFTIIEGVHPAPIPRGGNPIGRSVLAPSLHRRGTGQPVSMKRRLLR